MCKPERIAAYSQLPKLWKVSFPILFFAMINFSSWHMRLVKASGSFEDEEVIDLDDDFPYPRSDYQPKRQAPLLTEEMENLIKGIKAGGSSSANGKKGTSSSNSNTNGPSTKKYRTKKSKSSEAADQSSSNNGNNQSTKSPVDDIIISTRVSVTIPGYGKAIGRREQAIDTWKGIPYTSPPVGSLRFAPPEAATPWAPSKLDASKFAPDCYQLVDPVLNPLAETDYMSEDCLYLNVFTPAGHVARSRQGKFLSGTKKLPVMLWFHGGAFQQGAARRPEYDGRKLAERDIIVVSINYRLGALGFLVGTKTECSMFM